MTERDAIQDLGDKALADIKALRHGEVRLDAVTAIVEAIRQCAPIGPLAHTLEDELHQAVLRVIAEGRAEQPAAIAAEALKTTAIRFDRWYE